MKEGFKKGFGFWMGIAVAGGLVGFINGRLYRLLANNDEFMEKEKECDPEFYETLKKYRKEKES